MNVDTTESLVAYCRENKRVCPMPQHWSKLYNMLPDTTRKGAGWEPPLPLILGAWDDTPAILKMMRFTEHIEWAAARGSLEVVALFLRELREEDWFRVGE